MIRIGNYLEGRELAESGEWFVINVADPYENPEADIFFPFYTFSDKTDTVRISTHRLDVVADIIAYGLKKKGKVFIHCTAGMERSPLAVAWYYHKYKNMTIDKAYREVRRIRPETLERKHWIKFENYGEWLHNLAGIST